MFRAFLTLGFISALAAFPAVGQSDAPVPAVQTGSTASSSTSTNPATKKVWTNENFNGSSAASSPSPAKKQSQKNAGTTNSQNKGGDPATAARIKQALQKLQPELADINLKLDNYKKFLEGETVSNPGRDISKGYSRTPVAQQMATLQEKKKQLELQIDALYEEARKKEIEPGQLR